MPKVLEIEFNEAMLNIYRRAEGGGKVHRDAFSPNGRRSRWSSGGTNA